MSVRKVVREGRPVRWEAKVAGAKDPATGKYPRRVQYAATRADAVKLERQMLAERDQVWGAGSADRVGDWLARWLKEVQAKRAPKTYAGWRGIIEHRVLTHPIASRKLRDVTPLLAQELVDSWDAEEVANKTRRNWLICVSAAFTRAMKLGLIGRNPFSDVEGPKTERRRDTTLSREQWGQLVARLWAAKSCYADILLLLAYTGCRISEITGAQESWLDEAAGLLLIHDGKTEASDAPVPLRDEALAVIERARQRHTKQRPLWDSGVAFREHWLVRNPKGHRVSDHGAEGYFQWLLGKLGFPYSRPHDLRHYVATEGLDRGLDMAVVSKLLRHKNLATTVNLYAHARTHGQRAALEVIFGEKDTEKEAK